MSSHPSPANPARSFEGSNTLWRSRDVAALAAAGSRLRHLDLGELENADELPAGLLSELTQLTHLGVCWPEYIDREGPMPAIAQLDFRRLPALQSLVLRGTGVAALRGATALTALTYLQSDDMEPAAGVQPVEPAVLLALAGMRVRGAGRPLSAARGLLAEGHAQVQALLPSLAAPE